MVDLLLNEEEYLEVVQDIVAFANRHNLGYDGTTQNLVKIALTMMMAVDTEEDSASFVLLGKAIYNIGYRDSLFFFGKDKTQIIH